MDLSQQHQQTRGKTCSTLDVGCITLLTSLWPWQDKFAGASDQASNQASEAYASATSNGNTKSAYQKSKDGAASAYAYASDAAETVGQQAEAARRAALGQQQKGAWEKTKVCTRFWIAQLSMVQQVHIQTRHCAFMQLNLLLASSIYWCPVPLPCAVSKSSTSSR